MPQVSITISQRNHDRIRALAEADHRSISNLAHIYVKEGLDHAEQRADHVEQGADS